MGTEKSNKQLLLFSKINRGPEKGRVLMSKQKSLTAETVESTSLPFQGVHDVHGSDGLPLGMLRVSNGIADHVLQEDLEHASRLFVDEARYALYSTASSQPSDSGFGYALDVVAQNFPMTLGSTLAESFASLSSPGHSCC